MEERPADNAVADELLGLARNRQFDALEAAWMRQLEVSSPDLGAMFCAAEYLVRKKFVEQAAVLLWSLVAWVAERHDASRAVEVATRAATIAPGAQSLRDELGALYIRASAHIPEAAEIVQASGLLRGAEVKAAVHCIECCLQFRPGSFVIHARSRRVGRVVGFQEGRFAIESDKTVQHLAPADAAAQWEPLPSDDFRALTSFEPGRLRLMAQEDPAHLVQLLLRSCGGRADFKQLKSSLIPTVIAENEWSGWWSRVKVALKRCSFLEVSDGVQPQFTLRAEAIAYSDEVRAAFDGAPDAFERARRVASYLAEVNSGHEGDPTLAEHLGAELLRLGRETADMPAALSLLSAAGEVHSRFSSAPDPRQVLAAKVAAIEDMGEILSRIPNEETSRMVLTWIREVAPERWPNLYSQAFPACSLRLCEVIAKELLRAGRTDLYQMAVQKTLSSPAECGEAFGWVWRWFLSSQEATLPDVDRISLTVALLELVHRLARAPRHADSRAKSRQLLGKLRNLMAASEFRLIKDLIAKSDEAAARRLHQAISSNEGLTAEARQALLGALRECHAELFAEQKRLWEDGFIYSTVEGIARRQAELEKLLHVDMPRNAEAIGKAAAHGDLRENWEYKAALEERDRLLERAGRIREELDRARPIPSEAISGKEANVGTRIRLRHLATGRERTIAFLGPWDADIPHGIYSYLAPLSQRFMGATVGTKVQAAFEDEQGEYEILAIERIV